MPAAPQSTSELLTLIQRERVIRPELLDHYLQSKPVTSLPALPDVAARRLVKDGLISDFQAELLLLGQPSGLTLGRYKLTKLIGRGGMSSVYLAEDTRLPRNVAVKVFSIDDDVTALQKRFEREARAAAAVDHPNVVKALDFGDDGKQLFLVMEYVSGTDLHRMVKSSGPVPAVLACYYMRQAATGLQALHDAGIIHRDVKPGNFLATNDGQIKLCDLGIVRFLAREQEPITTLHVAGGFLGTPQFLAPEQLEDSRTADARSDIYGLGATLYFLLTGKCPRRTMISNGQNALTKPTPILQRKPDLPPELAAYIERLLDDEPDHRPSSGAEVARDLDRFSFDSPLPSSTETVSAMETQANTSLPTPMEQNRPREPQSTYRPVTESTPTLAYVSRTRLATVRSRRRGLVAGVLATLFLTAGFIAFRPAPATLADQVATRLVTDKAMTGAEIQATLTGPGRIILSGAVLSESQKRKALAIAEQTAGVETVTDELTIK